MIIIIIQHVHNYYIMYVQDNNIMLITLCMYMCICVVIGVKNMTLYIISWSVRCQLFFSLGVDIMIHLHNYRSVHALTPGSGFHLEFRQGGQTRQSQSQGGKDCTSVFYQPRLTQCLLTRGSGGMLPQENFTLNF